MIVWGGSQISWTKHRRTVLRAIGSNTNTKPHSDTDAMHGQMRADTQAASKSASASDAATEH